MGKIERCVRCRRQLAGKHRQHCWYCGKPLCTVCSDCFGVCGCPGSEQAQQEVVKALTRYKRGAATSAKPKKSARKRARKTKA
jgi:hypothetical protein